MTPEHSKIYDLLPVVHRLRDNESGNALSGILEIIQNQIDSVRGNINQFYDDCFIETCQPWLVPYLGDLVGIRRPASDTLPDSESSERELSRQRLLYPRGEVARAINQYRRKGTRLVLENLAKTVANWPGIAVERYPLVVQTMSLEHPDPDAGRLMDFNNSLTVERLNGPSDTVARVPNIRKPETSAFINSPTRNNTDIYNPLHVGMYLWRIQSFPLTKATAKCLCVHSENTRQMTVYSFNPLGIIPTIRNSSNSPLYTNTDESDSTVDAIPAPIGQTAFTEPGTDNTPNPVWYGRDKSIGVWIANFTNAHSDGFVPRNNVIVHDLSEWKDHCGSTDSEEVGDDSQSPTNRILKYFRDPNNDGKIAIDPELGLLAIPGPPKTVEVLYYYGFSGEIGGGEYRRPIKYAPVSEKTKKIRIDESTHPTKDGAALVDFNSSNDFLNSGYENVAFEIRDSRTYRLPIPFHGQIGSGQKLTIKSANGCRPVLELPKDNCGNGIYLKIAQNGSLNIEGLVLTGNSIAIAASKVNEELEGKIVCGQLTEPKTNYPTVNIQDCTIRNSCADCNGSAISIDVPGGIVRIKNSIVGTIDSYTDKNEATRLWIADSILDSGKCPAVEGKESFLIRAERTTFFGKVSVREVDTIDNCIFNDLLSVERRQQGGIRYSYIPPNSETPARFYCQPDLANEILTRTNPNAVFDPANIAPRFTSTTYGDASFGQLKHDCPVEIKTGADDESEMGAFHDLYQPQREANLRSRLSEFTPVSLHSQIIFVN